MGIFRRGRNTEESAPVDEVDPRPDVADDLGTEQEAQAEDDAAVVEGASTGLADREQAGPFDVSEVDLTADERLDLGALRVRGIAGMELRLEIDENAGQVVGATAVVGESAVQLQAFAAPRSAGIWDDIRDEIAESVLAQGGTAEHVDGELGRELRTRMPSAGPDGRTVFAPARFAGVDGPRWFLRAVFSGRAAIDDEAARPLVGFVRDTVVVRGDAAMAPREMLALTLPEQPAPEGDDQPADDPARVDDLKPFERGPEITEVR